LEDLIIFGPMDERAMASRPVEDFIPQVFLTERRRFVLGDTSGTTGTPKVTAYRDDEFYGAFVEYFGFLAEEMNFPKGVNWLWIGPSGPHIIGKAARMLSRRMESMDPFSIDFDPRWVKKLTPGSLGWERYFHHLEEQSMNIMHTQKIEVLFSTPPVIERLASKLEDNLRERIRGVHYGGMSLSSQLYRKLKTELFPNAVHISGYGNTLFGVCLEVESNEHGDLNYFSPGPRLILRIVPRCDGSTEEQEKQQRLEQTVNYGERGQVVFHRLDESFLIINMFERDEAKRIPSSPKAQELGLFLDGVGDPLPMITSINKKSSLGIY
jgi:thienamycin biosynthesis protein ThnN